MTAYIYSFFYRIKGFYYIKNKFYFFFFILLDDDSARRAPLAHASVCVCVYVFMMDVFLLSSEARCILDGIRRGSKKTASSLSASPPLSLLSRSLAPRWRVCA